MKNKSNIFYIILIIAIILIAFILIATLGNTNKANLINLTYKQVEEKIANKDSFILVISQSTCTHCATYKPKLEKISKDYEIDIFDIDYDLENKEVQKEFLEEFNLDGSTPITIFIKDGKQTNLFDRLEGDLPENQVIEKFKEMGFIKK